MNQKWKKKLFLTKPIPQKGYKIAQIYTALLPFYRIGSAFKSTFFQIINECQRGTSVLPFVKFLSVLIEYSDSDATTNEK